MTILFLERLNRISKSMQVEAEKARMKYKTYHSFHEAYAVLKEEVEELWTLIKLKQYKRDDRTLRSIKNEVIQIGSIAILIMHDFNLLAKCQELNDGEIKP